MTERLYVLQLEEGWHGSMAGEIVAAGGLDEMREYVKNPPEEWRGTPYWPFGLAVYECVRVDDGDLR